MNSFIKGIPFSFLQLHLFRREPTFKSRINREIELEISCLLPASDGIIDMAQVLRGVIGFSSNLLYQGVELTPFFIG